MGQILSKLKALYGQSESYSREQVFRACAAAVRERLAQKVSPAQGRQVHYLSMEFLLGRSLEKNLFNLGLLDEFGHELEELGFSAEEIFDSEHDAGLGNGGLGRLAACYMDSMASLDIPASGYCILFEYGIFKQRIEDGRQMELPDTWLDSGEAWLMPKYEEAVPVVFGGRVTERWEDRLRIEHEGGTTVLAVPYDMLICGWDSERVNTLRLWSAKAVTPIDPELFSKGEYVRASEKKTLSELVDKILYPDDTHPAGKELRLKQQYFFSAATIGSIVRNCDDLRNFHKRNVIHINDTHPALAIPELMRVLLDEAGLSWDEALHIVKNSFSYTNHTVLPEALERWDGGLIERVLPRIWQILLELNRSLDIIENGVLNAAKLCASVSFCVNGVSKLHSDIIRKSIFRDVYGRAPDKFTNVTNGIDFRRWLAQANPKLDALISDILGTREYLKEPEMLRELLKYEHDGEVLERLRRIKYENKKRLCAHVYRESGRVLDPDSIFDVQAKRLHEYKRQLLNVLQIVYLINNIEDGAEVCPRTFVFAAKAAPGYYMAKRIIELINSVGHYVYKKAVFKGRLDVVFLEDYRVSLAEKLIPAAEISEQISLAGYEASGTGNMKFMLNGAITMGTLDGANVEIRDAVGENNMFLFGMDARQVKAREHEYDPYEYYNGDPVLRRVLERIRTGFGKDYSDIVNSLLCGGDRYMLLADFQSYVSAQRKAEMLYRKNGEWNRVSLVNIASSGRFSADRAVKEYSGRVWGIGQTPCF